MKIDSYRLLGFAFASADLFIEVDERGVLGFALGAGERLCGLPETRLCGLHWRDIIAERDHSMIEAIIASLGPAERRGPVTVQLRRQDQRRQSASLSLGRLPRLETISMALSLSIPENSAAGIGVFDANQFIEQAQQLLDRAEHAGKRLELSLIELSGLRDARTTMTRDQARQLDDKIDGAMRATAYGGTLVGRLADESFAIVRPEGEGEDLLAARLNTSLRAMLDELYGISAVVRPFTLAGHENPVLMLKHAMNAVAKNGAPEGQSLADTVSRSIKSTLRQAATFRSAVCNRQFSLSYQPIVSLETRTLHHHEVLVRFNAGESPQTTILMAEELDLIKDLDWAVVTAALEIIEARRGDHKLAVNLSGRSISDPVFLARLRKAIHQVEGVSERLIFEVTESSKINDLDLADKHIQSLRSDGHIVCLDDFGAGAASFAYLQRLQVDVVKVDGQYIKALGGTRQNAFVSHLVRMCHDLGVKTIAEMIETADIAEAARQIGFDYGQGYFYGRPTLTPEPAVIQAPARRGRRQGAVEMWG